MAAYYLYSVGLSEQPYRVKIFGVGESLAVLCPNVSGLLQMRKKQ